MKYQVTARVSAKMELEIEAKSHEEALATANDIMSDIDCGPLSDIDWDIAKIDRIL